MKKPSKHAKRPPPLAQTLASMADLARSIDELRMCWSALAYAWNATVGQHTLGQNEDELITFANLMVDTVDRRLREIEGRAEGLSFSGLASFSALMRDIDENGGIEHIQTAAGTKLMSVVFEDSLAGTSRMSLA